METISSNIFPDCCELTTVVTVADSKLKTFSGFSGGKKLTDISFPPSVEIVWG
jgi:hypothetical protein